MVVIGGWLGAGKTTLVNRLLGQAQGERIAVVVNDIGKVAVDADLVQAGDGDTVELTNGCVCCSIGDSLAVTLRDLVLGERPPERIVVEASGVAEPDRVAAYGDRRRIRPDGVVVAVDALDVVTRAADPVYGPLVSRQIAAADVLVVTKADLADDGGTAARQWCASVAADTPAVMAAAGGSWIRLLLGGLAANAPVLGPALEVPVEVAVWEAPAPVKSCDVARALADAPPGELLRAKGVFAGPDGQSTAVHLAGRRIDGDARPGAEISGRLVLVGRPGWDRAGILALLDRAVRECATPS